MEPTPCPTPGCSGAAVTGDGPVAPCWACIYRFGDAAARPSILTDGEILLLLESHGDVIELSGSWGGQRWRWREE